LTLRVPSSCPTRRSSDLACELLDRGPQQQFVRPGDLVRREHPCLVRVTAGAQSVDQLTCARGGRKQCHRAAVLSERTHVLPVRQDRKSTRLNSSHASISY